MNGAAPLREPVAAGRAGYVSGIDSRRLARVAKLAGARDYLATHPIVALADEVTP